MAREMFKEMYTGEIMTYEEMKKYCEENYDYGDETNIMTYVSTWWREYGFKPIVIENQGKEKIKYGRQRNDE